MAPSIDTGMYTILNVKYKNNACLDDNNDATPVSAAAEVVDEQVADNLKVCLFRL